MIAKYRPYRITLSTTDIGRLALLKSDYIWYTTEDLGYLFNGTMDSIILARLEGVTSVVCNNDQVASILIHLLKRNNLSIPKDISIVSFDNSFLAKETVCNLTSVVYLSIKIGKKAANLPTPQCS